MKEQRKRTAIETVFGFVLNIVIVLFYFILINPIHDNNTIFL